MCSAADDPTFYAPTPAPPRRIVTAGNSLPRGSVALAVLGKMLQEAEEAYERSGREYVLGRRMEALREARNRVLAAESQL